jgi:hypothetical protein
MTHRKYSTILRQRETERTREKGVCVREREREGEAEEREGGVVVRGYISWRGSKKLHLRFLMFPGDASLSSW